MYGTLVTVHIQHTNVVQPAMPGVGDLFTIMGRMNCALSLAGHKIN